MNEISLNNIFISAEKHIGREIEVQSLLLELCIGNEASFIGRMEYNKGIQHTVGILEIKEHEWDNLWKIIEDDNAISFTSDLVENTENTYFLDIEMEEFVNIPLSEEKSLLLRNGKAFEIPIYK